jgi:hypothetical protein
MLRKYWVLWDIKRESNNKYIERLKKRALNWRSKIDQIIEQIFSETIYRLRIILN